MKFDSPYDPKQVEEKIYKIWEKSGFFAPDNLKGKRSKKFSVMMAPPNITGSLHMGHALENTLVDVIVRMKRMQGYKTLWLPGTDHAGIAGQNAVEKELRKQGIRRQDLGREKFLEKMWEWKEKYNHVILDQLKKLGALPDWSRTKFTLSPELNPAVEAAFNHYCEKGWIYQGERVINWCSRCETAISDLEIEYREEKGKLYHIKYVIAENSKFEIRNSKFITVATTRPETMLGDTAVAVNPKDSRYKRLVGKFVNLPIQNRKIPVISDMAIDMKFGTGAVKVTPASDVTDFEIARRHNLETIQIVDEKGFMTEKAGNICQGLKADDCRLKVVEKLEALGLLQKVEDCLHNVGHCERCGTKIEPRVSRQWFLKMTELAKLATEAIRKKETVIYPKKWEKITIDWLKNVHDWNISRQLWWGHKIPVKGEDDVLDTWFSSALWPFSTLGWPRKTDDLENFYPTDFITSAREILNLWIVRMIFSGKELMNRAPFKSVYIHGTILTKDGKRMSKSLGTGVDPLLLIEKYGADATRFGLLYQNLGNQDIRFSEDAMITGKKFCNKIWNATRFVLMSREKPEIKKTVRPKTAADRKIIAGMKKLAKDVDRLVNKYQFGQALHELYDFFWHQYADIYIETAKKQMADEKLKKSTEEILLKVHSDLLKLLHPFMPFVTEEIWESLGENQKLLLVETWPK